MAKIAVESVSGGPPSLRVLAQGKGWTVADVIYTSGPRVRPFHEKHSGTNIAIVINGTFQYRSNTGGCEVMTPASLLLGNSGQCFVYHV